ncbi:MAG TPA: hypothetical protein VGD58_15345 [Herpetosiphonaceae bacterium]
MTERTPDQTSIGEELKELGRQLTVTIKAVAGSEQVRSLGSELKDGLREVAQNVEDAWEKVRERDEIQRLQARASDVAESFKTGEAQQEIREEIGDALRALNARLSTLVARLQPPTNGATDTPVTPTTAITTTTDVAYTGATQKLES